MKRSARLLCCSLVCGVVVLAGGILAPWGSRSLSASEACEVLWREQIRGDALAVRDELLNRCLLAKQEAVNEVIRGRMTLHEAARRFQEAQSKLDDGQDEILGPFQAVPEEELCQCVIRWVECTLKDESKRSEVVSRLRKELAQQSKGPF